MLRDLEGGGQVEAAQIIGDMRRRALVHGITAPNLGAAWVHLQCYQAGRQAR